jgi:hypothetical protein
LLHVEHIWTNDITLLTWITILYVLTHKLAHHNNILWMCNLESCKANYSLKFLLSFVIN